MQQEPAIATRDLRTARGGGLPGHVAADRGQRAGRGTGTGRLDPAGGPGARPRRRLDRRQAPRLRRYGYRGLYLRFDSAFDWSPYDPRLEPLAEDLVRFRRIVTDTPPDPEADNLFDDDVVGLMDARVLEASPAWQQLGAGPQPRSAGLERHGRHHVPGQGWKR